MSSDDADKAARKAARAERKAAKAAAATPADAADIPSPPKRKREDSPSLEAKIAKQEQEEGLLEVDVEAPEPLSKAQARKEAKKAAKRAPTADGEVAATEPPKKKKKVDENAKPKRANSIWIGNLSFKTTADELKAWFTKELEALRAKKEDGDAPASELPVRELVTRVNMPMKEGRMPFKQSRGFAYVDFALPSLQRKALRLSEKLLDGRKVLIKMGDDYAPTPDARTPKPLLSIKAGSLPKKMPHGQSSSLFVGNLDFKSTEEELWAHVESNFEALRAPSAFGRDGKRIKKPAKDEDGSGSDESGDESSDEEDEVEKEAPVEAEQAEPTEDSVEAAAAKLPAKETCGLKKVRMPTFEDSGKCKGFAFLDFVDKEHATIALANRANHYLRGRKLVLQYASQDATKRSMSAARRSQLDKPADGGAEGGASDSPRGSAGAQSSGRMPKWEAKGRQAPGAALAAAKRQTVAIVAGGGAGKKTTFD